MILLLFYVFKLLNNYKTMGLLVCNVCDLASLNPFFHLFTLKS